METFYVSTNKGEELIDITHEVEKLVNGKTGICYVFVPHSTCALFLNENESGLVDDFIKLFNNLVPYDDWKHDRIDNNARAHLKSGLIGQYVFLPVKDGKFIRGTWQNIFLAEFEGPRDRKIVVDVR